MFYKSAYLTYYQKNRDLILNRAKDYYKNDIERLREQARYKYRNLSEVITRKETLNIIINKIVFLIVVFSHAYDNT